MLADFGALIGEDKVWVLESEGVQGYIVMFESDGVFHVENVAVHPFKHGCGFGGQLLEFAESEAKERGYEKISLYTNVRMTENLSFYPAHGYRETGRRNEDGFDRVYFSKELLQ